MYDFIETVLKIKQWLTNFNRKWGIFVYNGGKKCIGDTLEDPVYSEAAIKTRDLDYLWVGSRRSQNPNRDQV